MWYIAAVPFIGPIPGFIFRINFGDAAINLSNTPFIWLTALRFYLSSSRCEKNTASGVPCWMKTASRPPGCIGRCEKNTASGVPCSPFSGITETDRLGNVISRDPDDWNGGRGVVPNPAQEAISITFSLSERSHVQITINDRPDRVVASLKGWEKIKVPGKKKRVHLNINYSMTAHRYIISFQPPNLA